MESYTSSFSEGMKVEIRIPVPYAKAFTDWAVISSLQEDLISLQLSRDILPEGVSVRVGQVLECRNTNDTSGCSHQAIVVGKGFSQELHLRLVGEIAANEHREFFRIDIFLPLVYHISHNQKIYTLQKLWAQRRKQRKAEEASRKRRYLEQRTKEQNRRRISLTNCDTVSLQTFQTDYPDFVPYEDSWHSTIPHSVNICGGGMSLVTEQGFEVDEYVLVEMLIPTSQRVIDLVARVIFSNRSDGNCFNTGMQFVFIDESDRSAIVNHIAQIQAQRIRQMQGLGDEPLYDAAREAPSDRHFITRDTGTPVSGFNWLSLLLVLGAMVGCGIIVVLVLFLASSLNSSFSETAKSIGSSFDRMRGTTNP